MCDVLRKVWWLVESLLMWFHVCVVVNCAMLWKCSCPHYLCELVICIILRDWLWQVLCALRKNGYLRGCTILRDVSRAAMDTIFRGTYRAPRWLLLSRVVSCAATDAWTDCNDPFSRFEQQTSILEKLAEATDPTTDRQGHDGPSPFSFQNT